MELPKVYRLDNGPGPQFLILGGTHGNENGPCGYLKRFVREFGEKKRYLIGGTYWVVPEVNPLAVRANMRHLPWQPDINRSYPNKSAINRFLDPLLRQADHVIDFHEAWGYNQCQSGSLGQTLYTNDVGLTPLLSTTAQALTLRDRDNQCGTWTVLDSLPPEPGVIDAYMDQLGKSYVLIEIAGQNSIQPRWVREDTTAFVLEDIFLQPQYYNAKYRA